MRLSVSLIVLLFGTVPLLADSTSGDGKPPELPPRVEPRDAAGSAPILDPPRPLHHWYPHDLAPPFLGDGAEGRDRPEIIYTGNARFLVGTEPELPGELLIDPAAEFAPGYWIVHFRDGVDEDAHQLLDDLTGEIVRPDGRDLARWYLPNGALIAYLGAADLRTEILDSGLVDWLGPYHPAYKLSPFIGSTPLRSPARAGRNPYVLNVDLMPGHDPVRVSDELTALGLKVWDEIYLPGRRSYDVHYLIVEAAPRQIVTIAQVEGVRFVQETGDGVQLYDLSGGGKLQNRALAADDGSASPIVTNSAFPLWLDQDLQGQGQLIGVVDTSIDWNNVGTAGCNFGFPGTNIDNYGLALPNLSRLLLNSVGSGGVNLKIPRSDLLGGATLQGTTGEHGAAVAGAALADFYGNDDTRWWEHDVDNWESWSPTNYSGLLGPGIAHEAQLYFTPALDNNGGFRWESPGEFPTHMSTTLNNMAAAGVSTTAHSLGIVEAANTYTQTSLSHEVAAYDNPDMLQFMAAGNDGAGANRLSSQAVVKNAITIGASDDVLNPEARATFSSTGPTFDNRIKPDVMAPGTDTTGRDGGVSSLLILPQSNGTSSASCVYQWTSGTSFSAPTAAGAGALVHQYFEEGRYGGVTPILDSSAALIRAILVNAGHRLTGANLGDDTYPNFYQGWGEPNLSDALEFAGSARNLVAYDVDSAGGFSGPSSASDTYDIQVTGSSERLRVTLAWTDEPGSVGTGKKLINDLHLIVTSPGGTTYRGNVINGSTGESTAGGAADTDNVVENVILSNPQAGTWTVTVDPSVGNYSQSQGYALVITGQISEGGVPTPPVADFSGTPTSGDTPLDVAFTDLSSGSVSSWSWTFGDGGNSSAQNPVHTYNTAGTFTVSMTATGPGGFDTETKTAYVVVSDPPPPPVAEFSGTPTSGDWPLLVGFSDLSTGSVSSYSWTFGDGGSSTAANPSHTYTAAGTYTVSLTVDGPGGFDTETKVAYIAVSDPPPAPPVAGFSGSPTSGDAPLVVSFSDESTGSVDTWSWNFGDGGTSTAANPSHTYTVADTYSVSLTVSGPGGSDTFTLLDYVSVDVPPPPPVASFSGSPTGGIAPVSVSFTDTSSGNINSWSWSFGDGGSSTAQNPSHTYPSAGAYTVSLTVTGPGGADTATVVDYISVSDPPPVADFAASPLNGTVPLLVGFTDTSTGPVSSWSWDFGDGGGSTAQNPSHTYNSTGVFTVTLTATGPGGSDVRTRTDLISVSEPTAGPEVYMSFTSGVSLPGLGNAADEDVVLYEPATDTWSRYFDGSDVGVGGADINAFHVNDDGSIVISFNNPFTVPDVGSVDDSDLVLFNPTSTGSDTSGTFSLYFDGSDVGLTSNGEDIDGVTVLDDGNLLISTVGRVSANGASGRDEDVLLFTVGSLGASTSGTFSLFFDGSDVGLSNSGGEDLNAFSLTQGVLYFSTVGSFSALGIAGDDEDISSFTGTFGAATSGSMSNELDLSTLGIAVNEDVDGLTWR